MSHLLCEENIKAEQDRPTSTAALAKQMGIKTKTNKELFSQ